ncbi:NAD-dependent epimerase/dehydratase family protein [Variovorax terrae]|uniref:NAD-dependent epimerase/dehydratase family protein n=1 Tax=Variovorax terrae TaxID=2923278 RepID=A0A9X1W4A8_9BURK|nr:NAD-dependent epimerase/dehydratase family protein [Variovorax terrae]MCJ0765563.1 NAD-dependent epimerase/dehydratase family protein [Variovorax terrae]
MKVLVTGAAGFVGAALAARIAADPQALGPGPVQELALADLGFPGPATSGPGAARVRQARGDIADPAYLDALIAEDFDLVFHLASVPGGQAERDSALGTAANLHAATRLLLGLAAQTPQRQQARRAPPVLVFTSTVAVYGAALPAQVDEATLLRPATSYGAHKLMTEILLSDLSRRGTLDGRAVRLPGIVARPAQAGGHVSAFMSNIFHALAAGQPFDCPVSAEATCWWMSRQRCVDNLLQLARMSAPPAGAPRVWAMPVLRHSMAELVDALARRFGDDRRALVRWRPEPAVEAQFGRQPPLVSDAARALGLADDGDIDALVERALAAG